jgi:hypothetical protein
MNTKNDSINELVELFQSKSVTTIKNGVKVLDAFFKEFEFHPLQNEYRYMTLPQQKELVKTIINVSKTEVQPQDTTIPEIVETDINDDLAIDTNEISEVEPIVEIEDDSIILEQIKQLEEQLKVLRSQLKQEPKPQSKMNVCKEWKTNHPTGTRADFFKDLKDLGSKAMLSTYYQKIK